MAEHWTIGRELLERRGAEILSKINENRPQFLIEVDLPESEIEDLLRVFSRYDYFLSHPYARACLAVCAVHLANRAAPEETSYVDLFVRRFQLWTQAHWQTIYGPAIAQFLHQTFGEPEREGPFRFVGPVYRHAGVPRHALGAFARLIEVLLRNYGAAFTRSEYDNARSGLHAGLIGDFLSSDAGYEFARDTIRILVRLRNDGWREIESLPGFPSGFWPDLLAKLDGVRLTVRSSPPESIPPQLVFDFNSRRLGVRISPQAIRRGTSCGSRRLVTEWDTLRTGGEVYHIGNKTWYLPWNPRDQNGRPALFRTSDGVFVGTAGENLIPAGTYFLVTSKPESPPAPIVIEDCGYLEWDSEPFLLAWRVKLSAGYSEPRWHLAVAGSALPCIRFAEENENPTFGNSVYFDFLPRLILDDWSTEARRAFLLCIDRGNGPEYLDVPATESEMSLNVRCPSEGLIWIEPRGRTRYSTEQLPRIPFTVIPSGIEICGTAGPVREDKPTEVAVTLPAGWALEWKANLSKLGPGKWHVPPGVTVLDGDLTDGDIEVHISWRVPRWSVHLRTAHQERNALWPEDLESDAAITVHAPAALNAVLTVRTPGGESVLWDIGPMPSSHAVSLRTLTFRDFLRGSTFPAAEIGIRLGVNATEKTGIFWIGDLDAVLKATESAEWRDLIGSIPELGSCLCTLSRIRAERQRSCGLEYGLSSTPIQAFIANCSMFAESLDGTEITPEGLSRFATAEVLHLCAWIRSAKQAAAGSGDPLSIAQAYDADLKCVPFARWDAAIDDLRHELRALGDIPGLVHEWCTEVRTGDIGSVSSRIARLPDGGSDLTQGAFKYMRAMQNSADQQKWLLPAASLLGLAAKSQSPLVSSLARALWYMAIHRLRYASDPREDWTPPAWLTPAAETLRQLGVLKKCDRPPNWGDGLGFREISPAIEDAELEHALGRSKEVVYT